jgi:hypothetical protein
MQPALLKRRLDNWLQRTSDYCEVCDAEALGTGGLFALALGVYGYAAVPRVGLGPTAPPLCRYAVHTKR